MWAHQALGKLSTISRDRRNRHTLGSTFMLPRERVLRAIHHEHPDRVPRDFWAEPPALRRLLEHTGHADEEGLLEALAIDIRHLNAGEPPETEVSPGLFRNFWGEQYVYRATPWGPMREDVKGALAAAASLDEIARFPFPSPAGRDYSGIREAVQRWDRYAVLYGFADVWQRPALVRGWENWFLDMVERPEWIHFLCRKFTDFYLEDYTRAAEAGILPDQLPEHRVTGSRIIEAEEAGLFRPLPVGREHQRLHCTDRQRHLFTRTARAPAAYAPVHKL